MASRCLLECAARDTLHDDVEHALDITVIIDIDQMRVAEIRHGFGISFKSFAPEIRLNHGRRQNFDGNLALQRCLHSAVESARAVRGDQLSDLVAGQ